MPQPRRTAHVYENVLFCSWHCANAALCDVPDMGTPEWRECRTTMPLRLARAIRCYGCGFTIAEVTG